MLAASVCENIYAFADVAKCVLVFSQNSTLKHGYYKKKSFCSDLTNEIKISAVFVA